MPNPKNYNSCETCPKANPGRIARLLGKKACMGKIMIIGHFEHVPLADTRQATGGGMVIDAGCRDKVKTIYLKTIWDENKDFYEQSDIKIQRIEIE